MIADIAIDNFVKYLKEENESQLDLEIDKSARDYIISEAQTPETLEFGGRGVVSRVEKLINEPVGDFLFENAEVGLSATLKYEYGFLSVFPK